jgi:hypothetical protein
MSELCGIVDSTSTTIAELMLSRETESEHAHWFGFEFLVDVDPWRHRLTDTDGSAGVCRTVCAD